MASSHNVELEAAKFLHKLIQDSKDEPAKLATKLYVILQHMKSSGKEHSMPYQVISRAMETVINQHGLDIEALKSSRIPVAGGTQTGDSAAAQYAGSSQVAGGAKDPKVSLSENEMSPFASGRPPAGPSSAAHHYYQGSGTHRTSQSFDHESPSSLDTRSANSQSQERGETMNQNDGKKGTTKRKRGDSSLPLEPHIDNPHQLDTQNTVVNQRKGKMNRVESPGGFSIKSSDHANFNMVASSGQMDHFSSLSANVRPATISNSMSRVPNSKYPDEVEVSSATNASGQQQGGSLPPTYEILSSRSAWNQNKAGLPFERSQVPRFSSNATGNMTTEILMQQSGSSSVGTGAFGKFHGGMPITSGSYPEKNVEAHIISDNRGDEISITTGRVLEHSNVTAVANKILQGGRQNSNSEMPMIRTPASRDTGKSLVSQAPLVSGMPFKEQQLKQLRAQCLVFLAFRNGLMPKKLHLEIALGNIFPKDDGSRKEVVDHREKAQSSNGPSGIPEVPFGKLDNVRVTDRTPPGCLSTGRFIEADSSLREVENSKMEDKNFQSSDLRVLADERKHLLASRKLEAEIPSQETMELLQPNLLSARSNMAVTNLVDDMVNDRLQVGRADNMSSMTGINKQVNPEMMSWSGICSHIDISRGPAPTSGLQHELLPERKDHAPNYFHSLGNSTVSENQPADSSSSFFMKREHWKPVSGVDNNHHTMIAMKGANVLTKHGSQDNSMISDFQTRCISDRCNVYPVNDTSKNGIFYRAEQEEEDKFVSTDLLASPKYTMLEKWIMDQRKKKIAVEQNWVLKQQKTNRRIVACFNKLKENVSSSEDISAKTKSVIELKKLQLLELQRRLRSDFLGDFFKPIATDMERLKSYKKHRHGRRIKQLEKFEQKMKEERQKRIRERQKEFFGEIEVHKERLDDVFKIRKERWKGFNRYVKEFHKRKERIHREKIDRIQREKINLLKINDVEGYLRMVQDAKSDRVKQLLKETEKYLQKLGSKLQEAKSMAKHFENDMDEPRTANFVEKSETTVENEDEGDQAKHYLESNEKYYKMAHSIKENITEQPTCLQGGKLREYQMNGLRWLVSLYNNHLNGILADEMGLGKTVQVIALICYLMETKNDRGPFLVVVPSSVLPGWESEINFWAPGVHKIVYAGPPEERRRLFKEKIVHQKFNVLLTTYEYLMNKHDRPKLSKVHWHYIIIDEGHRIKNASCKLNADLKHYQSSHRLLLTGTPLQNNLEELWALLNFLLPNIFNSSEDFSQWFNKPFQSNGDSSADEALLSEEENLLIINRLHQVLRPFVLRRLKHKVENELPEKIERLIRCEASAYQKLLMKRVEENLGSIGNSKARSVHNSVMELRNICNHPYLSQLHADEVDSLIPKHFLPPIVRLCGKLEMLDRLLPKLKATDHRVLFFSTMTRLLDVMEEYLNWKQYRYLRLDGHTLGSDRGALIDQFNQPDSPVFIFLLSIRAGGVGVNLQAADTVIIFDTDWNPQVDLQAQARAHRIGQKRDVLVLRFETVQTVEEQVRAAAEHKLGVANQSITAGFFDNNTSAEDRREYLEALLRECKKEEAAPVLDDDGLNDILARSESEIDIFESVDRQRREYEIATWKKLVLGHGINGSETLPPLPSRLVTDDDLETFYEAMKLNDVPKAGVVSNAAGVKRKSEYLGGLDTQQYGRGKRAREVRSYEEQWTEEEFEKLCQVDSPESPKLKEEVMQENLQIDASVSIVAIVKTEPPAPSLQPPSSHSLDAPSQQQSKEVTPPSKRGRGRPRRATADTCPAGAVLSVLSGTGKVNVGSQSTESKSSTTSGLDSSTLKGNSEAMSHGSSGVSPSLQPTTPSPSVTPSSQSLPASPAVPVQSKGQGRKMQSGGQAPRRRGKKPDPISNAAHDSLSGHDPKMNEESQNKTVNALGSQAVVISGAVSSVPMTSCPSSVPSSAAVESVSKTIYHSGAGAALNSQSIASLPSTTTVPQSSSPSIPVQSKGQGRKTQSGAGPPRRRGKKQAQLLPAVVDVAPGQDSKSTVQPHDTALDSLVNKAIGVTSKQENDAQDLKNFTQEQACGVHLPGSIAGQDKSSGEHSDNAAKCKLEAGSSTFNNDSTLLGTDPGQINNADSSNVASMKMEALSESTSSKAKFVGLSGNEGGIPTAMPLSGKIPVDMGRSQSSVDKAYADTSTLKSASSIVGPSTDPQPPSTAIEGTNKTISQSYAKAPSSTQAFPTCPSVSPTAQSTALCTIETVQAKKQGRKTPSRGETPRRRGRKQGTALPAADGSVGQDPKSNLQSQNKSRDSLASKAISLRNKQETDAQERTNVTQLHASEVHSPGGFVSQDPKRREASGIPPFGRFQTADVNDVARVMKEIFSETCSSKTKVGEASAGESRNMPTVPSSSKMAIGRPETQTSEDSSYTMPALGAAPPVIDVLVDQHTKQPASEADGIANISHNVEALVPQSDVVETECRTTSGCKSTGDSGQLSNEKLVTVSNMEVSCAELLEADVDDGFPSQRQPTFDDDLTGIGDSSKQLNSPVTSPRVVETAGMTQDNVGPKTESSTKEFKSHLNDMSGPECHEKSMKVNDAHLREMTSVSGAVESFETDAGTEIEKVSLKSSPCDVISIEDNKNSAIVDGAHDHAGPSAEGPVIPGHPAPGNPSDMTLILSGESESMQKALESYSLDIKSTQSSIDSVNAVDVAGHSRLSATISVSQHHSDVTESSGIAPNYSRNQEKTALEESPKSVVFDIGSVDGPSVSVKAGNVGKDPPEPSTVSENPVHSAIFDPCAVENSLGNVVEVPLMDSPKSSVVDTVSSEGNTYSERPLVSSTITTNLDNSGLVNLRGDIPDESDMPSTEVKAADFSSGTVADGSEASPKAEVIRAALGPVEIAAGNNSTANLHEASLHEAPSNCDNLEYPSNRSKDEGNHILEVSNSVYGESTHVEHVAEENGEVGLPLSVEGGEGDHVKSCNMEVDTSVYQKENETPESTHTSEILPCVSVESTHIEHLPKVHGEVSLPLGVESSGDDQFKNCDMDVDPSDSQTQSLKIFGTSSCIERHAVEQMSVGVENADGCHVEARSIHADPLDAKRSPLGHITAGSTNVELFARDNDEIPAGKTENSFGVHDTEINSLGTQASSAKDISCESVVRELVQEEHGKGHGIGNYEDECLKVCNMEISPVEDKATLLKIAETASLATIQHDHDSAELQSGVESMGNAPIRASSMGVQSPEPCMSLTTDIAAESGKKEEDLAGAQLQQGVENGNGGVCDLQIGPAEMQDSLPKVLSCLNEQEPNASEAQVGDQIYAFEVDGTLTEIMLEPNESKAQVRDQMDACQADGTVAETISENIALPTKSLVIVEEKADGFCDKDPVENLVAVEETKGPEAGMVDDTDIPHVGRIMANDSLNMVQPSSSVMVNEEKIEVLSEVPGEIKVSESGLRDQVDVSHAGIVVPEHLSEKLVLPESSLPTEEKSDEQSSKEDPVCGPVALCQSIESGSGKTIQMDVMQIDGVKPENMHESAVMPSSLLPTEEKNVVSPSAEEKVMSSSEDHPHCSSVVVEESRINEAEVGEQMGAHQLGAVLAENTSDNMFQHLTSAETQQEKAEGLCGKSPLCSSVMPEELKCSETGKDDQTDVFHVRDMVAENISENLIMPSSSLMKLEKKSEDSPGKGSIFSSAALEESIGSEIEKEDQTVISYASENTGLSLSSLETEQGTVEGAPERDPHSSLAVQEESDRSETGKSDQMPALEPSSFEPGSAPEDMGLPLSVSVEGGEKIAVSSVSSDSGPHCSSAALDESKGIEDEHDDRINVPCAGVVDPENTSENVVAPTSSAAIEEGKTNGSLKERLVGDSVMLKGSDGSQTELSDKVDVCQVGSDVLENLSENVVVVPSSSVTEEGIVDGSPVKDPVGSSVAPLDSKKFEADANDPLDGSQDSEHVPESASEDRPTTSLAPDKQKTEEPKRSESD